MSELTQVYCELHWHDGRENPVEVSYQYNSDEVDVLLAALRQQLEEDEHLLDLIYEAADGLPQDGEKVPGGRKWVNLPEQIMKVRQRVEELEHDNKNLLSCQCENCDNSLEEEAVCRNCYRISRALLDNEKENVKACCTVLNEKDCYIADLTAQLAQVDQQRELQQIRAQHAEQREAVVRTQLAQSQAAGNAVSRLYTAALRRLTRLE
jgi:hypothetical protein